MKHTKSQRRHGGSFRFDWKEIGNADPTSRRSIRRIARQLAAPPGQQRRSYGRAKLLTDQQLRRVVDYLRGSSRVPESDVLKVYLSYHAGLRACEIARLTVRDVTDAAGQIAKSIFVPGTIAKGGHGRTVPMSPTLARALKDFMRAHPGSERLAISTRSGKTQTPNALSAWFWYVYRRLGFHGCSSHSGRRWFITQMARLANNCGATLVDVQEMAGHARLDSTQIYIDPITDNMHAMAASLCGDDYIPENPQSFASDRKAKDFKDKFAARNELLSPTRPRTRRRAAR